VPQSPSQHCAHTPRRFSTEFALQRRLKPLGQRFVAAGVVADNESLVPTGAAVVLMEELRPLVTVPHNQMGRVAEGLTLFLHRLTEMGLKYRMEFLVPESVGWCGRTGEFRMRCDRESVVEGSETAVDRGRRVEKWCIMFADGV
jgi:hypothetical protein